MDVTLESPYIALGWAECAVSCTIGQWLACCAALAASSAIYSKKLTQIKILRAQGLS
jgi:hypothetical protein